MSTELFYANLPSLTHFSQIIQAENFVPVPEDWYVLVADIQNSTQAIAAGQYKEVNLVGASSIMAVLNAAEGLEIPFVFGGDGATLLVPPSLVATAREVLLATQATARVEFEMHLRVGVVPVTVVRAAQYEINISKLQVSEHYSQANFRGGGLTYATALVKDDRPDNPYQVREWRGDRLADFSGLECRWQDIPIVGGEALTLIVAATPSPMRSSDQIYQDLLDRIGAVYGRDYASQNLRPHQMKLTFNPKRLTLEMRFRAASQRFWHRAAYLLKMMLENGLGWLLMWLKATVGDVDWGQYKVHVLETTDFQKFEDGLRMVIAGRRSQTEQMKRYLYQQFQAGNLIYGMHVSNRVMMTCLILERAGSQVHFIDGADGGYTAAALMLKHYRNQRLSSLQSID
jgi:hypothetical protein